MIFVSWCADQCGYLDEGVLPKMEGVLPLVDWFREHDQWQYRDYEPNPGDLIFYDWENDGIADHVGIVERVENGLIYSVEGNVRSVSMITDKVTEGAGVAQSRSMSVSAAANQMVNNTTDIARNCVQASESASVASDITNSSVAQISQTINGIQDQVNKSKDDAELVRALVEQAQKIGNIVNTIEDIANQTNLLALNAAIEAARAGTYGKGFAVVADEVRALASRTSKSTSEITSMVKQIQSDANSANATLQRSLVRMNELAGAAADVESHLQTIQEHVGSAAEQITQIATAANEQTSATSEISDNINQIKDIIEGFNVEVDSSHQEISASVRQLDTLLAQVKKITV